MTQASGHIKLILQTVENVYLQGHYDYCEFQ